jgi:hypothetical protein
MFFINAFIIIITFLGLLLGFKFLFISLRSIESPNYKTLEKKGNIELREYPAMILASIVVEGKQIPALSIGFKKIADYIFGNNSKMQRIAMTAPVLQIGDNSNWQVAFIMPAKFNIRNLPKPAHSELNLRSHAPGKYIVLRFSGSIKYKNLNLKLKEFNDYLLKNNCAIFGKPVFAFYNPPWTLPFMRRNEIWYKIKGSCIKSDKAFDE